MMLAFSRKIPEPPPSLFPVVAAFTFVGASVVLISFVIASWASISGTTLCVAALALWMLSPHEHLLTLTATLLPIRDRSGELPDIFAPALEDTKARLILNGSKLSGEMIVHVGFDMVDRKGVAHLNVRSNLDTPEHSAVQSALHAALLANTTQLERMKMAIKTFSASIRIPDPAISNHKLMQIAEQDLAKTR